MQRYIKKPVPVHAFQWDGHPETLKKNLNRHEIQKYFKVSGSWLLIYTLEGVKTCRVGSYVIKGVQGEFYPCNPKIFKRTYKKD